MHRMTTLRMRLSTHFSIGSLVHGVVSARKNPRNCETEPTSKNRKGVTHWSIGSRDKMFPSPNLFITSQFGLDTTD